MREEQHGMEEVLANKRALMIESLVKSILSSSYELYDVVKGKDGDERVHETVTGKAFLKALKEGYGQDGARLMMYNPYLELFISALDEFSSYLGGTKSFDVADLSAVDATRMLNDLVKAMRSKGNSEEFKRNIERIRKAQTKRMNSTREYVDRLFSRHSRLLVIRLDLSYRKGMFLDSDAFDSDLERVKADWGTMKKQLDKGVPVDRPLGFIVKLEYGVLKGFHYHCLFFFAGDRYRGDVAMAYLLGEYWMHSVTAGDGRYWNCNAAKESYYQCGIGMINHYDYAARQALVDNVLEYLVKPDYHMDAQAPRRRVMFRGNMPRAISSEKRRGRPRDGERGANVPAVSLRRPGL